MYIKQYLLIFLIFQFTLSEHDSLFFCSVGRSLGVMIIFCHLGFLKVMLTLEIFWYWSLKHILHFQNSEYTPQHMWCLYSEYLKFKAEYGKQLFLKKNNLRVTKNLTIIRHFFIFVDLSELLIFHIIQVSKNPGIGLHWHPYWFIEILMTR